MAVFNTEKIDIVGKSARREEKQKKNFFSGPGVIAGGIRALSDAVSRLFGKGKTAQALRGYGRSETKFRDSTVSKSVRSLIKHPATKRMRLRVAGAIEKSMFVRMSGALFGAILRIRSRQLGSFLFSFGGYSVIVYCIKRFAAYSMPDPADLIGGAVMAFSAIPLMFSGRTVVSLAHDSGLFSGLHGIVGDAITDDSAEKAPAALTPALVLGILCGLATLRIPALTVAGVIAGAVLLAFLFRTPEIGIPVLILLTPFASVSRNPSFFLGCAVAAVAAAFLMKVILGKRSFIFGVSEVPPALFLLCVLLSALPGSHAGATESALMSALLASSGFLAVCLIRTRKNLEAAAASAVLAASAVAFIGIIQFILGDAPSGWTDVSLFPGIRGRVTSVFANPNMLGAYLVTVFPFTLYAVSGKNRYVSVFTGVISSAAVAFCAVLTWSRAAWVGLAAGAMVFIGSFGLSKLAAFLPVGCAVYLGAVFFPDTFGRRLRFFSSLGDSANYYRKAIWTGVIILVRRIGLSGIGAGDIAFSACYIAYSLPGIEGAVHSHSLFLQLIVQMGFVGLILFLITVTVCLRKAGWAGLGSSDRRSAACVAAAAAAVIGLCVSGVFDYVLYNYRVLCSFWTVLGLLSAAANICRAGMTPEQVCADTDPSASEIEIRISGSVRHERNIEYEK